MSRPDPDHTSPDGGRPLTDRALIARIAAAERWARTADRRAATEPARRGLRERFEREVDPYGVLDLADRARRADALFTAHMLRLSRASARSRRGDGWGKG